MGQVKTSILAAEENWAYPSKFAHGDGKGNEVKFIKFVPFIELSEEEKAKFKRNRVEFCPEKQDYRFSCYDKNGIYYERNYIPSDMDEKLPLEMKLFCKDIFNVGSDILARVLKNNIAYPNLSQPLPEGVREKLAARGETNLRKYYAALSFFSDTLHSFLNSTWVDINGETPKFLPLGIQDSYNNVLEWQANDNGRYFLENFSKSPYFNLKTPGAVYKYLTEDFRIYAAEKKGEIVETLFDFMGTNMGYGDKYPNMQFTQRDENYDAPVKVAELAGDGK